MTRADPEDDSIERWVAFHYLYDPERSERRNVIVDAFNSDADFRDLLDRAGSELRALRTIWSGLHAPGAILSSPASSADAVMTVFSRWCRVRGGRYPPWVSGLPGIEYRALMRGERAWQR